MKKAEVQQHILRLVIIYSPDKGCYIMIYQIVIIKVDVKDGIFLCHGIEHNDMRGPWNRT